MKDLKKSLLKEAGKGEKDKEEEEELRKCKMKEVPAIQEGATDKDAARSEGDGDVPDLDVSDFEEESDGDRSQDEAPAQEEKEEEPAPASSDDEDLFNARFRQKDKKREKMEKRQKPTDRWQGLPSKTRKSLQEFDPEVLDTIPLDLKAYLDSTVSPGSYGHECLRVPALKRA